MLFTICFNNHCPHNCKTHSNGCSMGAEQFELCNAKRQDPWPEPEQQQDPQMGCLSAMMGYAIYIHPLYGDHHGRPLPGDRFGLYTDEMGKTEKLSFEQLSALSWDGLAKATRMDPNQTLLLIPPYSIDRLFVKWVDERYPQGYRFAPLKTTKIIYDGGAQ